MLTHAYGFAGKYFWDSIYFLSLRWQAFRDVNGYFGTAFTYYRLKYSRYSEGNIKTVQI